MKTDGIIKIVEAAVEHHAPDSREDLVRLAFFFEDQARNLRRSAGPFTPVTVTEGHIKKCGTNPPPSTPKPHGFRPPGQGRQPDQDHGETWDDVKRRLREEDRNR